MSATGLPNSTQTITCVGAAVPFPDWSAIPHERRAIPTRCADGSSGTVFASASPNVTLFDAGIPPAESLRAAADWSGPVLDNRFVLGVQGIMSSGLHQPDAVDVNLHRDPALLPRRTKAVARCLPIRARSFVHAARCRRGAARASQRVSARVGAALRSRHPLAADQRQPQTGHRERQAASGTLTYTLLDVREQYSGFSSTAGDPFARAVGRSARRRHDTR